MNIDKLGGTAFPNTCLDKKTNHAHPGMPLWAWFFGQALAGGVNTGSIKSVIEHAEEIADKALEAYEKRMTHAEAPPTDPGKWEYFGVIENPPHLKGTDLHVWRRLHNGLAQCAISTTKLTPPHEDARCFSNLHDMVGFHMIDKLAFEDFIRRYVKPTESPFDPTANKKAWSGGIGNGI